MREILVLQGANKGAYFVCDRSKQRSKAGISPLHKAKPIVKCAGIIAAGALKGRQRDIAGNNGLREISLGTIIFEF